MMCFVKRKFLFVLFAVFFIFVKNIVECRKNYRIDGISETVDFVLTHKDRLIHESAFRRGGTIIPSGENDKSRNYSYNDDTTTGLIDEIDDNAVDSSRRQSVRRDNKMSKREDIHSDVMESGRRRLQSKRRRPVVVSALDKSKMIDDHEEEELMDYDSQVSYYSIQGRRNYMEDEYIIVKPSFLSSSSGSSNKKKNGKNGKKSEPHNTKQDEGLFTAIFDGHGGTAVSRYLRQNLYAQLQTALPLMQQQQMQQDEITESNTNMSTINNVDGNHSSTISSQNDNNITAPTTLMNNSQNIQESKNRSNENKILKISMDALRYAFQKVDSQVQRISHWSFQGSTAVVAWLLPNPITSNQINGHRDSNLIVANVGDSRAVYIQNNDDGSSNVTQLTLDHKPNDPIERQRILDVGGTVQWCGLRHSQTNQPILNSGVYRINGNLALARAIGDRSEKPFVSSEVDIQAVTLPFPSSKDQDNERDNYDNMDRCEDDCVVLASDGLWDVMSNEQIQQFLQKRLKINSSRTEIAKESSDSIMNPSSSRPLSSTADEIDDQTNDTALYHERRNQTYLKQKQKARHLMAKWLIHEALKRGSTDNITIIIIWLSPIIIKT